MGSTSAGARAFGLAHRMQLQAAMEGHPQHVLHVRDQIDYTNAVADHYYQLLTQYIDTQLDKMVKAEVDKSLADPRVQLKVDEKSVQAAKKSIRSIFDVFR